MPMRRMMACTKAALVGAAIVFSGPVFAQVQLEGIVITRTAIQTEVLWGWAAEELERRTGGDVTLEITSLPELGLTGFELVRVLQAGLADVADVMPTYVAGDMPVIEGADLVGLFGDYDTAVEGHLAWEAVLREKYADELGAVVLGSWPWAQQLLYSNKPVESLEDLRGLKIRVFSPAMSQFVSAVGAEPISLPYAEVYTALDRGTIDGAITCAQCGWDQNMHEVTDYLVDLHMGTAVSTLFVVSKRTWEGLSPELQELLAEIGSEFTERGWRLGKEWAAEGIENLTTKGGMTLGRVPDERGPILELIREEIAPWWGERAGTEAKADWNEALGQIVGFTIP
jgi:TRAP-type transport system periplasmic protein